MLLAVVQAFLFFLPAGVANGAPVFFQKWGWLKSLAAPIDKHHTIDDETIFGEHKTWRGIIAGSLAGIIIILLESLIYNFIPASRSLFLFPYELPHILWLGFLLGLGAMLGDLIKSFFKRRLHIKNGASFFPFDQLDFLIGAITLGGLVYVPSWTHLLIAIVSTPLLHFLSNLLAYHLKLKKVWW